MKACVCPDVQVCMSASSNIAAKDVTLYTTKTHMSRFEFRACVHVSESIINIILIMGALFSTYPVFKGHSSKT